MLKNARIELPDGKWGTSRTRRNGAAKNRFAHYEPTGQETFEDDVNANAPAPRVETAKAKARASRAS